MLTPKESIQKIEPYVNPGVGIMGALRLDFNEKSSGSQPQSAGSFGKHLKRGVRLLS